MGFGGSSIDLCLKKDRKVDSVAHSRLLDPMLSWSGGSRIVMCDICTTENGKGHGFHLYSGWLLAHLRCSIKTEQSPCLCECLHPFYKPSMHCYALSMTENKTKPVELITLEF